MSSSACAYTATSAGACRCARTVRVTCRTEVREGTKRRARGVAQRNPRVHSTPTALTATGAPQLSYYRKIASQLGLSLDIEEFRPARVGTASVGDFLYGDGWPWSWIAGVELETYGTAEAATLDCRLQLEAPEYTDVVLGFGKEVVDGVWAHVDQLFHAIHYVTPAALAGIED